MHYSINCLIFFCLVLLTSCNNDKKVKMRSPAGYDLNKPFMIKLPPMLDEISGISYYSKDRSVFGIVDENGVLFKILLQDKPVIQKWKFYEKGDYEDIVRIDSQFYGMMSNGSIVEFSFKGREAEGVVEHPLDLEGFNEFEIMYHDEHRKELVLICKDCEADKKSFTTAYAFDPVTKKYKKGAFVIDIAPIAAALGEDKVKFKPSAAAIHPVTQELYMISAVNDCLVIADRNGKVKQVILLDPKLFKQPEGLCFTPEGHLIISNESADIGAATILVYKYKNSN